MHVWLLDNDEYHLARFNNTTPTATCEHLPWCCRHMHWGASHTASMISIHIASMQSDNNHTLPLPYIMHEPALVYQHFTTIDAAGAKGSVGSSKLRQNCCTLCTLVTCLLFLSLFKLLQCKISDVLCPGTVCNQLISNSLLP